MSFFGGWQQRFQPQGQVMGQGRPMAGAWGRPQMGQMAQPNPAAMQQRPIFPGGGYLSHTAQDQNTQVAPQMPQQQQGYQPFAGMAPPGMFGALPPQTQQVVQNQFQPNPMQMSGENGMMRMGGPNGPFDPNDPRTQQNRVMGGPNQLYHQQLRADRRDARQQSRFPTQDYVGSF